MSTGPSAKELKVKASCFIEMEPDKENLNRIQKHLTTNLEHLEYFLYSANLIPFGPTYPTMEFVTKIHIVDANPSIFTRIKGFLGIDVEREKLDVGKDESLDRLKTLRDDIVYQYVFYFLPVEFEENEGFDVRVEATPVLLQKFRQLDLGEDYRYNLEDVIQETKDQVKKVIGSFGVTPYNGPYTEAEAIDPLLPNDVERVLQQLQYGRTILEYINQGDRNLESDHLHAALSCYIHSIEWAIICYKYELEDIDLIKEQEKGERLSFSKLVHKIETDTPVTRLTYESLKSLNAAERRWIAHHREGAIPRTSVDNVREILGKLIGELFREKAENL